MKQLFIIIISLFFCNYLFGQEIIDFGKITYEKKINVYKEVEGTNGSLFKTSLPRYQSSYFNLYFDNTNTLFEKANDEFEKISFIYDQSSINDRVWINSKESSYIKEQFVLEERYFIKDKISELKWKMTGEVRRIAGFDCQRAETIVNDSIYVIAFYTDKINANGGPYFFRDLPGVILGIVVPRLNLTLFATGVEYKRYNITSLNIDRRNSYIKQDEFRNILNKFISIRNDFPKTAFLRWLL